MKRATNDYVQEHVRIGNKVKILSYNQLLFEEKYAIDMFFKSKKEYLGMELTVTEKKYHGSSRQWYCKTKEDDGKFFWWPTYIESDAHTVPSMKTKGLPEL